MYGLITTVPPVLEPVTIANAKNHAKIDLATDDALVAKWITAAREMAEDHTSRAWVNQTLKLSLRCWPRECTMGLPAIRLPRDPVSSISSLKYYSTAGVLTTLVADVDFQTWLDHSPPLIAPAPGKVWPTCQTQKLGAVEVVFVAGYGASSGWPARAEEAIYLTLTYWNRNRGDDRDPTMMGLPDGAIRILDSLWSGSY